jgi:hypothetical protein
MDEELKQLEAELKRLRPVAPSAELHARIGAELRDDSHGRAAKPSRVHWLWVAALPAAAAVGFLLNRPAVQPGSDLPTVAHSKPAADDLAREPLKPVAMENVLYSATDEGLVTLEDGTTARRERLRYVDTITWRNPRTKASLQWTVPREEVRVVPVVFQ